MTTLVGRFFGRLVGRTPYRLELERNLEAAVDELRALRQECEEAPRPSIIETVKAGRELALEALEELRDPPKARQ